MVNAQVFGPERAVREYFAALEDGSADQALEQIRVEVGESDRVALTDAIYAEASARPTDLVITGSRVDSSGATVDVEYDQDGHAIRETLALERRGTTAGVFDQWRLVSYRLGSLDLMHNYDATEIILNGVPVPLTGAGSVQVFPGEYQVALPGPDLLESSTQTVRVYGLSDQVTVPELTLTPTEEFTERAEAELTDFLAGCLDGTAASGVRCPSMFWVPTDVEDLTWTITTAPEYSYEQGSDASTFYVRATGGTVALRGTYAGSSYLAGGEYADDAPISFSGQLTIEGDDLTFSTY